MKVSIGPLTKENSLFIHCWRVGGGWFNCVSFEFLILIILESCCCLCPSMIHATLSIHLAIYLFQKKWNNNMNTCSNYNTQRNYVEPYGTHVRQCNMRTKNPCLKSPCIPFSPLQKTFRAIFQLYKPTGLPFKELLLSQHAYNDQSFVNLIPSRNLT